MPKLSIITINYNNASGLRKTIESVVCQTSKEFEYIIIDGGSTDGSVEVIKEFVETMNVIPYSKNLSENEKTSLIRCSWLSPFGGVGGGFLSEPDSGIYNAMNKGIRMAKGEYCQFLNSGDYLVADDVTEQMLNDMPECSILYGNMLKLMPGNWILYNKEVPVNSLLTFYKGALNHSSAYIKRSLFEKYGYYDEKLRIVSDWKFYLITICLNNEPVVYKNIDVTYFDMNGISNTNSSLDKAERLQVLKETLPATIFADYEKYATSILQMKRINRYKLTKWFVWFIERVLFKIEKVKTKKYREHIYL